VVETVVSGANGAYQFTGLCPATYTVVVTTPPGYTPTTSLAGTHRSKDSNGSNTTVALVTSDLTVDFGFKAVTSTATGFTTYTQGGWGTRPNGNNPGSVLLANFARVYPGGSVSIGGTLKPTFTSAVAIEGFLPQGGTPAALLMSASNPTTSNAGVLAGQALSLQLGVDFSNSSVTKAGLGALKVVSGKLAGQTVTQVLALANSVLGGGALPTGVSLSDLNGVLDSINQNYDNGTSNNGYLQ